MSVNSLNIGKHKDKVQFKLKLDIFIGQEEDFWIAFCPSLELSSYADKENKIMDSFKETLSIYLEETWRKGTLEKDLLRLGWALRKLPEPNYEPPKIDMKKVSTNFHNPIIRQEQISLPVFC